MILIAIDLLTRNLMLFLGTDLCSFGRIYASPFLFSTRFFLRQFGLRDE